jgi:hypothetical protein
VSAAVDARGLNKRPIKCPNCEVEFSGEIKLKARRGRVPAVEAVAEAPVAAANDQFEEVEATENTISLEEVEEAGDDADEETLEGGDIEELEELADDDLDDEEIDVKVEKE